MRPTDAQRRVLSLLAALRGDWARLAWLDHTPALRPDDIVTVPSLIENGWAEYGLRAVRITAAGCATLEEAERSRAAAGPLRRRMSRPLGR